MKAYFILPLLLYTVAGWTQSFTKVTIGPLVNTPGDSRSVNWVDVNNDGYPDCMITNGLAGGQNNMLYINTTSGGFTAVTADSIVLDGRPSDGATWADADNDGDADCFVANWYNTNNLYYTNDGAGNFTRINSGSQVNDAGYSETAAWGDYDNDGLVDLYVTNSATPLLNFLYKNTGAGGFIKIMTGPMATDAYPSRCVNWTDMDLDGDVDLFITNENGQNENIYRNDGMGMFTAITAGPLLTQGAHTMSGSWGDYDNDGDLDVFLANDLSNNSLFRNDGNFSFTKITGDTVSKEPGHSMSSAWSDVDNDGDLDLFVTNAYGTLVKRTGFFYLNNGNGSFSRISNNAVTADSAWTYGCAFGDYDNDGFEDLAVATCRFEGVDYPDFLYHNNGNANQWITIKLQGTVSNRSAIGAKIKLKATLNGSPVWQLREISAQNAYCSQNDIRAHFGLGNATQVDSVKIEWPSGILQYSTGLAANQFMTIVEALPVVGFQKQSTGQLSLKVFPNPATRQVVIESEAGFSAGDKLIIYSEGGGKRAEIVMEQSTRQYLIDLKKHNLSAGAYFISCRSKAGTMTQKMIIAD